MKFSLSLLIIIILIISCSQNHDGLIINENNINESSNFHIAHQQNFDTIKLQSLISKIYNGRFGDVHSLIISRNNQIVLEKYFNGYDKNDLHRIYSVTKSVTSSLIGIAIDNGHIENINQNLLDFFPEYSQLENLSTDKENIILENVLTMSSGFKWDEWSNPYGHPNNSTTILWNSNDMLKHMLDLPLSHVPGTHFTYNSGGSILLSGILQNKVSMSAEEFADNNLFSKIGIDNWDWWSGNDGLTWTSGELHLKPIEMLKFGELYINNGLWDGNQIISENWIQTSTSNHIQITNYNNYGYFWWAYSGEHYVYDNIETEDIYYAIGHAGQYIWVIPHLDIVVVSTAGNEAHTRKSEPMLWEDILPALN